MLWPGYPGYKGKEELLIKSDSLLFQNNNICHIVLNYFIPNPISESSAVPELQYCSIMQTFID
jgi:hypothetical protein